MTITMTTTATEIMTITMTTATRIMTLTMTTTAT